MRNQHQNAKIIGGIWLSRAALSFVALAAIMGWGASFVGLHAYGLEQMVGFSYWTAWLVPGTFDGAAFGATLITYRASIHGRSAVRGRLLMWTFTAISSWINWIHQMAFEAQIVAAGLPVAAVAVFDVVLAELRADYEERHGKRRLRLRPGLLALRWLVDRTGTAGAFRQQVTDIPVSEIAGLAQPTSEQDQEPQIITDLHGGETEPRGGKTAAERESADQSDRDTEPAPDAALPSTASQATTAPTAQPSTSDSIAERSAPAEQASAPDRGALPDSRRRADTPSESDAEMTRPGLLLPFAPDRPAEPSNGSSDDGTEQPLKPLPNQPQWHGSAGFAERWARARDEITADQHQDKRPELLVVDRRGAQPTRSAQPAATRHGSNGHNA